MLAVPVPAPVTTPLALPMVATDVLPLLHVPATGVLLSVVVTPTHVVAVPDIGVGSAFTVTVTERVHPVGNAYDTTEVPSASPDTMPDAEPMLTLVVLLLVHVPPVVLLASTFVMPRQAEREPVIAFGSGFTVIPVVVRQPVGNI